MKRLPLLTTTVLLLASLAGAQAPPAAAPPAATPAATPAAAPPAPAIPITDADLKGVETPKPEVRAKGDPDGSLTGTAADVTVADFKQGLTLADLVNHAGQDRIAINFVW